MDSGVSVMAYTKHYVVLAMLKPGVAAASEGMPCRSPELGLLNSSSF